MPLLKTTVSVENRFRQITVDVNNMAKQAVAEGAVAGARAASAAAAARSKSGHMAAITVDPVVGAADGWESGFVSHAYYAWFQSFGTLGSRTRKLKRSSATKRTREAGTGIKPLRFLDIGRRAGRKAMLERLNRGL